MYHAPQIDNESRWARIRDLAEQTGYTICFIPTKYVRGWPQASSKPYALRYSDGAHIASFASSKALERNLRGRAGA